MELVIGHFFIPYKPYEFPVLYMVYLRGLLLKIKLDPTHTSPTDSLCENQHNTTNLPKHVKSHKTL